MCRFVPLLLLVTAACDDPTTGECTSLEAGPWSASGTCFGMPMDMDLNVDAAACSFTFSGWNMVMSVPDGGTVLGSEVTLTGSNWDDCTGTTDGTSILGTCGDGCAFDMAAGAR